MSARSRAQPWFAFTTEERALLERMTTPLQLAILCESIKLDAVVRRHLERREEAKRIAGELLHNARSGR